MPEPSTSASPPIEDRDFRTRTPIPEDPNEDRVQSPELAKPKSPEYTTPEGSMEVPSRPASPIPPESPEKTDIPKIVTPPPEETKKDDESSGATTSTMAPGRGKSKITGKDLSGWI